MSLFREIPPTAGLPVYWKDIFSGLKKACRNGSLEGDFRGYLGVDSAWLVYSGSAAFYLILESLKELSARKTVVIPAFVCPLLPLAIKRAGLKVQVCDINPRDFNFDPGDLERICSSNKDILAVVAVHLAGVPLVFEEISHICRLNGIFIIEDCAQSLGACYRQAKVGTLGDFSFFSLCRGKGLTIYEGGLIAVNKKEYTEVVNRKVAELVKKDIFSEGLKVAELFGYAFVYNPVFFWFVFRLPQIFWQMQGNKLRANIEYFSEHFPTHKVSALRNMIGHLGFHQIDRQIIAQRKKAEYYIYRLKDTPGVTVIKEPAGAKAVYPYLTLVFDDQQKRKRALQLFENSGLGVSQIYTSAVNGYDYLKGVIQEKELPSASYLAKRHITLSTSIFISENEMEKAVRMCRRI